MKNFIFTVIIAAVTFVQAGAKQVMTMLNGDEIEVEIVTIGTDMISYKKVSNLSGPTYSVNKNQVFFITYDDGRKEVITPINSPSSSSDQSGAEINTLISKLMDPVKNSDSATGAVQEKNYFEKISIYPRASVGYHGTYSGYKDQYDIDWGGLSWAFDLNVLFPEGNSSAWSIGLGVSSLDGEMRMLYTTNNGKTKHKDKMGNFTTMYFTIPLTYWYRGSDYFMFGFTTRSEFLISQKMEGKKVKDAFKTYRNSLIIDGIYTLGKLDLGLQLLFNFTSALKSKDLDWSPTIGASVTVGYRF